MSVYPFISSQWARTSGLDVCSYWECGLPSRWKGELVEAMAAVGCAGTNSSIPCMVSIQ